MNYKVDPCWYGHIRANQPTNEGAKEPSNERTDERVSERGNEPKSERTNQRTRERTNGRASERSSEWTYKLTGERTNERASKRPWMSSELKYAKFLSNINAVATLTCDQASLSFLFAAGRYAWYNYLTICLLLVQNLDFSLIGQETKGT